MGATYSQLRNVPDTPILLRIRHGFLGRTQFESQYRPVLQGRLDQPIFNSRLGDVNRLTSALAPSRWVVVLTPVVAIIFVIVYVYVLASEIGLEEGRQNKFHPALSIIFLPFVIAVVQVLTYLWTQNRSDKFFDALEKTLQSFNQKDNPNGVLWRLKRELPVDSWDTISRLLCWSCLFPKLNSGIQIEFVPAGYHGPVAQGANSGNTQMQQMVQTPSNAFYHQQLGAGPAAVNLRGKNSPRPDGYLQMPSPTPFGAGCFHSPGIHGGSLHATASAPTRNHEDHRPIMPAPGPVQPIQIPQPVHSVPIPQPHHHFIVATPSAPTAAEALYPFQSMQKCGASGGYTNTNQPEREDGVPPVYAEKYRAPR